jgi:predicted PurR-regulated permease PerM
LKLPFVNRFTNYLLIAVLGTIILVYAKELLLPIILALLLSLLLYPIYNRFLKWKIPGVLSVTITMLLVLFVILSAVYFISLQLQSVLSDMSGFSNKMTERLNDIQAFMTLHLHIGDSTFIMWIANAKTKLMSYSGDLLSNTINTTTGIFGTLLIVLIYIFCFLLYNKEFKDFIFAVIATEKRGEAAELIGSIKKLVQHYLLGMLTVIFIIGSLNTIGLLIIGIRHAVFFAFFAATLTIIPYIGISIGALLPVIYTFVMRDSGWSALGVAALFISVQFLESNFVTPKITGRRVSLNPFVAIVALLIGGQLWGIAGMTLAIPLTAILKVLLDHLPATKAYGYFLGTEFTDKKSNPLKIFGIHKVKLKKKNDG